MHGQLESFKRSQNLNHFTSEGSFFSAAPSTPITPPSLHMHITNTANRKHNLYSSFASKVVFPSSNRPVAVAVSFFQEQVRANSTTVTDCG